MPPLAITMSNDPTPDTPTAESPKPETPASATTAEATASEPTALEPTATPAEAPAASRPAANDESAAAGESTATEASGDKPSERIRIGTQRGASEGTGEKPAQQLKPKPVTKVSEGKEAAPQKSKYPPPNVRSQLSAEQEAELEAALAGESLDSLMESAGNAPTEIPSDTRLPGKIVRQHGDHVFVDLGNHRQGAIPLKQFDGTPPELDSEIDVVVVKLDDEGLYELSLPTAAVSVGNWDDVEEGQIVEVTVTGSNKGGLECQVAGLRGFMPMGQISIYRVENAEEYHNQRLTCVVTEANRSKRNLVLSHRALMERERAEKREKLLEELAPGQIREGIVRSLRDFGAFVDLGGVDGLVHVSKLSWDRVSHPKEVLEEGQTIKVKIDKIDQETGKIGLSYREMTANPWEDVDTRYPMGEKVTGTVSKIMDFGAFVRLEPGIEGMIHISELDHGRVFRTSDVVSEGQTVEAKVLSVDKNKQRIGLSLKALMARPQKAGEDKADDEDMPLPADAPKAPRKNAGQLKGGTGSPSGGEQFGLKW